MRDTALAIQAINVCKRFGKTTALNGLDLVVERGQVLAVLGPNGAGKTTFVRAVATLLRPDSGELRVLGHDVVKRPAAVRREIALAGQYAAVEPAMTGRENLEMAARLFGLARKPASQTVAHALDQVGLDDKTADRLVRTYSGGMRRKVDLAASIVGAPRLLLLDEPTAGLDPRSRIELWEAIRSLVDQGTDVLLTTQYLDEADHLAGQIVIIDDGRAVAGGSPKELKSKIGRNVIEVHVRRTEDVASAARALRSSAIGDPRIDQSTRRISIPVATGTDRLRAALESLELEALEIDDISLRAPTLDEVFLALTGRDVETQDVGVAGAAQERIGA